MIQKFIALITLVVGMLFLALGVYAFVTPDAAGGGSWTKAIVTGFALVVIGAVAMAGARRLG